MGFNPFVKTHFTILQDIGEGCGGLGVKESSANVIVLIQDGPDKPPTFPNGPYVVQIDENTDPVSSFFQTKIKVLK